jgi:hypothetical protein
VQVNQSTLRVIGIHNIVVNFFSVQRSEVVHILLSEIIHKELLEPFVPRFVLGSTPLLIILICRLDIRKLWGVYLFLDSKGSLMRGLLNLL